MYDPKTDLRICNKADTCEWKKLCAHAIRHECNPDLGCSYPIARLCIHGSHHVEGVGRQGLMAICTKRIYRDGNELDL